MTVEDAINYLMLSVLQWVSIFPIVFLQEN